MRSIDPTPINLDRERHLLVNNAVLKEIHRTTGRNYYSGEDFLANLTPDDMSKILLAMLRHEDASLT
jgi:hypothetical protein